MRVNLLPPELRERQRLRRRVGAVTALGVILLAGIGALYFLQQLQVNDLRRDLQAQEAENNRLRAEIAQLQELLQATQQLLDTLLANEVRWSGVLRDISLVIPGETWLTTLNGQLTEAAEGQPAAPEGVSGLIGQISFNGFGLSHRAVALWLTRLEDVEGFANPWITVSQKTQIGQQDVVQFSSTTDLSAEILGPREGAP
jgi:Tfp pilus assembly protein PilN